MEGADVHPKAHLDALYVFDLRRPSGNGNDIFMKLEVGEFSISNLFSHNAHIGLLNKTIPFSTMGNWFLQINTHFLT